MPRIQMKFTAKFMRCRARASGNGAGSLAEWASSGWRRRALPCGTGMKRTVPPLPR
jgi:hypothetical protein